VISPTRIATLLVGLAVTLYGAWLLLGLGWANTRSTLFWLVGGVVLHDGVFAPAIIVVGLVALRVMKPQRWAPVVVGMVILVPATLLAIPELGRFGARADNTTLLDRHYWVGWFVLAGLVLAGVVASMVLSARTRHASPTPEGGDDDDPGPGGR
jgi:hypothetical protein